MSGAAVVPLSLEHHESSVVDGGLFVSVVQVEMAGPAAKHVTKDGLQVALQSAVEALLSEYELYDVESGRS